MKNDSYEHLCERFPCTVGMAGQLFPVFWNEYLVRLNACQRIGVDPKESSMFVSKYPGENRWKLRFLSLRYMVASIFQLICLFLPARRIETAKPIFAFNNLSSRRFFSDKTIPARMGLYNFHDFNYPHILQILSIKELIGALRLAVQNYELFVSGCRQKCAALGENWSLFRRLTQCGRLTYFDAILHFMAFEKMAGTIHFDGHFEMYITILSMLREHGALGKLVGYQHGVFEYPPAGRKYIPMFTDEYHLLFSESEAWIRSNMQKNTACKFILNDSPVSLKFQMYAKKPRAYVVAFAAAEFFDNDQIIVNRILSIRRRLGKELSVLVYFHPFFPGVIKSALRDQGVEGFNKVRHKNVDLFITRCSTLGIEYQRIGVPVIFVPFGDGICVFESGNFNVAKSLEDMEQKICKLLQQPRRDI